jgi:hypothetical protein
MDIQLVVLPGRGRPEDQWCSLTASEM